MNTNVSKYLIDNKIFRTKKEAATAALAGKLYIGELRCNDPNYCLGDPSSLTHKMFGDVISIEKKSENHRLIDLIRDHIRISIEMDSSPGYYGKMVEATVKVYLDDILVGTETESYSVQNIQER